MTEEVAFSIAETVDKILMIEILSSITIVAIYIILIIASNKR